MRGFILVICLKLSILVNSYLFIRLKFVKFSKKVKPVCLPNNRKLDEIDGKKVVVTGW